MNQQPIGLRPLNGQAVHAEAPGVDRWEVGVGSEGAAFSFGRFCVVPRSRQLFVDGTLVDLGSGNGYPGIPLALARPGLVPVLAESNRRKASFLQDALAAAGLDRGRVIAGSVQRASDLTGCDEITVLATRAMGGWERIVPKLTSPLAHNGRVLLWAGAELATVLRRTAWRRLEIESERVLPGRDTARVACLRPKKI